jgi:crotonobetainyl-CoA:carnitine CoA-transferase CaiB-like acyl-CoA transferase
LGGLPLDGIRVIDLADEKAELCGRLLADLGADVIRVEPPEGAGSRRLPPFAPDGSSSLYFAFRNAGKRGVTLDPTRPSGRELLQLLLDGADVLIESFAPGWLAAQGLAPEALLERRRQLVITSISDFGQTGPYRDYSGTDMIGFAFGGMMHRAGAVHRPPCVAPGAMAYDAAGMTAAFATLMAYWKRLRTGRGQHLDVSVAESTANLSDWSLPGYSHQRLAGGEPLQGARAGAGMYPLYRCADGWVRMIVIGPHHWRALLAWMGNPEELMDPALEGFVARILKREAIDPVVERFFAPMPKVEVAREAQARGIPCTPLLRPGEVLANEHTSARGTFRTLEVLPGVEGPLASGFFELGGERAGPRLRAPLAGEHNRDVYADELGLGAEALAALSAQRVI